MKWIKRGLIYCSDGKLWWAKTHAMIPTPDLLDEKVIRVYASFWMKKSGGLVSSKIIYKAVPRIYHTIPSEEDLYALFRYNANLIRRDVSSAIYMLKKDLQQELLYTIFIRY